MQNSGRSLLKHTEEGDPPLQKADSLKLSFSPRRAARAEGTHGWRTQWLCPPLSPDLIPYLVGIHEVRDEIEIPVHRLVLSQLWLHLVLPEEQGLQSVHELA